MCRRVAHTCHHYVALGERSACNALSDEAVAAAVAVASVRVRVWVALVGNELYALIHSSHNPTPHRPQPFVVLQSDIAALARVPHRRGNLAYGQSESECTCTN